MPTEPPVEPPIETCHVCADVENKISELNQSIANISIQQNQPNADLQA